MYLIRNQNSLKQELKFVINANLKEEKENPDIVANAYV